MRIIIGDNPVENFMKENAGKNLSIKTIKKNIPLKYRALIFYIKNTKNIILVNPCEVGSGKKFLHLYRYEKNEL